MREKFVRERLTTVRHAGMRYRGQSYDDAGSIEASQRG